MRSRRSACGDFGDLTLRGEIGGSEIAGDFKDAHEEKAGLVAVDGCDVGEGPSLSNVNFG
jgi:hypothetical protein